MVSIPASLQPQLPKFEDTNVQGWLTEVKDIFSLYFTDTKDFLQYLGPLLPEYMKKQHSENKTKTWEQYLQAMKDAFQVDVGWSAIQDSMLMQTIKVGESPRSFLLRVNSMADKIQPTMPEADRCRIFLQLLPSHLADRMIDKVNSSVKNFIDSLESVISAKKLLTGHRASTWGLPSKEIERNPIEPTRSNAVGDKICALLEKLSVASPAPSAPSTDASALKLVEFVENQTAQTDAQQGDKIVESVLKLIEQRFPFQFPSRGGRGRGPGRGGYGPAWHMPQHVGYGTPYPGYGAPRAPFGSFASYQGYAQQLYRPYQRAPYAPCQPPYAPRQYFSAPQQAPPAPQQRAIMPPPQTVPQAPQPQGYQQETRVCYRCGVAGHLAYQCVQNQGF